MRFIIVFFELLVVAPETRHPFRDHELLIRDGGLDELSHHLSLGSHGLLKLFILSIIHGGLRPFGKSHAFFGFFGRSPLSAKRLKGR